MDEYPVDLVKKGAVEHVYTTHVTHPQQFFVHVESRSKILDEIMDKLAERYACLKPDDKPLYDKKIGSVCAAKFTDDNNWYRAKITGLMRNGLIEVQFVDYGNTDYVSEDRIRAIDQDLVQYPVQSYRCSLANVSCAHGFWTPELIIQFEDKVTDKRCRAVFTGGSDDDEVYLLQMFDAEGNNINKLFGATDPAADHSVQKAVCPDGGFKEAKLELGAVFDASVVYVIDPGLFWCQNTAFANDILILSEELSRLHMTQEIKPLKNVGRGTICAAKFSEDEAWYRGVVQSVSDNKAIVYFVDFGNTESVSLDVICNLKPEMRTLPALGIKCHLANVTKKGEEWGLEVIEMFEQLTVDKEFEVKVVDIDNGVYKVTLLDIVENKDVGVQLRSVIDSQKSEIPARDINSNKQTCFAVSDSGPSFHIGSKADVFLSWVESPDDFWVQLSESEKLLEQLSVQLQEAYDRPQPPAQPSPGAVVVARFSEDNMWYRGLVLKNLEDGHAQVLFIDYGNSEIIPVTELRQTTAAFGEVAPLAFHCCLVGVKPLHKNDKSWVTAAKDILEKLTENGCQCEILGETSSHKLVGLKVGDQDVTKELLNAGVVADAKSSFLHEVKLKKFDTEEVFVTYIESPQSFWCQLTRNIPALHDLMRTMSRHYSDLRVNVLRNPTLGQACIVQHGKDNLWYRASIVNITPSGFDVHFVDYGHMDFIPKNKVYAPEPRFLELPTQACHCSLPVKGDLNHLTATLKEAILEAQLQLHVQDVLNQIAIVELFDGKMKVSDYLKDVSNPPKQAVEAVDFQPAKSIPPGSTVQVFTSVVVSPSKFFIQLSGVDEELGLLMDNITLLYASNNHPPIVTRPNINQPCVALYSEDNHWYRGRIIAVQGTSCAILFVDYGNEDIVNNENIRTLTHDVAKTPVMAYQCSLSGLEETTWSEEAVQFFESLVMDQELTCTFVTSTNVKLSCGGQDVASQLVSSGYCKAIQATLSPNKKQSSVSIYKDGSSQRNLKDKDSGRRDDSSYQDVHSEFSTGQRNFRETDGGRREDSNYKDVRSEFGTGQKNLRDKDGGRRGEDRGEPHPYRCHDNRNNNKHFGSEQQDDDSGGGKWRGSGGGSGGGRFDRGSRSAAASEKDSGFRERRNFGESKYGNSQNNRKPNSNFAASGNSRDFKYADLPSKAEGAILVHMDESGIFYIQLPSMEKDILFLSKRIASSYKDGRGPRLREELTKGTICCARFPLDGSMYRARIEDVQGNSVVVRYVDYGNIEECSVNDLKFLFPDLLEYPVQAFPCKLRGLHFALDQAEKFAKATLDKDLQVTFVSDTCPFEVDIMTPNGDLLQILTGTSASPAQKIFPNSNESSPKSVDSVRSKSHFNGFDKKSPTTQNNFHKFNSTSSKKAEDYNLISAKSSMTPPSLPKQEYILPSPPQGDLEAFISHVGKDGYFYLQLARDTTTLESICDQLAALPENVEYSNPSKGTSCAAVFSEDSAWYRALITDKSGDNLSVTFVDYGNEDIVNLKDIKPLSSELLSYAPLAYKCQFIEVGPLSTEAQSKLKEYLMEIQLTVTFSGKSSPFDVVARTSDGKDLQEIVCPLVQYRAQSIPTEVTPAGVTHIETDGRFFLQLYSDHRAIRELQSQLSTACENGAGEQISSLEVGSPCCLKLEDGSWQRGKLVKVVDGSVHVFLVDTGKTVVTNPGDLQSLPAQFLRKPPLAFECRLKEVDSWADDLFKKFTEMTQDKVLNATFCSKTLPLRVSLARSIELDLLGLAAPPTESPVNSPEKKFSTTSIAATQSDLSKKTVVDGDMDEFLQAVDGAHSNDPFVPTTTNENTDLNKSANSVLDSVFTELSILPNQRVAVTVSYVYSPGRFYIQLDKSKVGLNEMMDALYEHFSNQPEELESADLKVGDVCAACYEDKSWYRVKIQSVEDDGTCEIFYMDYGNIETVELSSLRPLADKFKGSSPWALQATLGGVSPVDGNWTEEAVQELKSMVEDRSLLADILEVSEGNGECVVHLLHLGIPVHEELIKKGHAVAGEDLPLNKCIQQIFSDESFSIGNKVEELNECLESTHLEGDDRTAKETMMSHQVHSQLQLRAAPGETEPDTPSRPLEVTKVMDVSEIDSLEMTQPIMESTAMVTDVTLARTPMVTYEETDEGHHKSVKLSLHTEYDVTVSNPELPSSFHIQLVDLSGQYLSLMAEITEHVTLQSCLDTSPFSPNAGDACLVQHCGVWYRGQVTAQETSSWNVRSVDCGWEVNVSASELKSLPARFRELPAQAVPCYLAGIVSTDLEWSSEAITFFIDSTRETRLCMYVLEVTDDGKYGIYLTDLDNTSSQSINRAMVDLDFAEVVPGSNIEVQIEMEKTLDTDMLDDMEESFNEVSQLRYNEQDESVSPSRASSTFYSENPSGETYEESEICRTAKREMDKSLYHLVQIPKCVVVSDGNKQQSHSDEVPGPKRVEFNCASAVDRIDKMGCPDNFPDECLDGVFENMELTLSRDTTAAEISDPDSVIVSADPTARTDKRQVGQINQEPGNEQILSTVIGTIDKTSCTSNSDPLETSNSFGSGLNEGVREISLSSEPKHQKEEPVTSESENETKEHGMSELENQRKEHGMSEPEKENSVKEDQGAAVDSEQPTPQLAACVDEDIHVGQDQEREKRE